MPPRLIAFFEPASEQEGGALPRRDAKYRRICLGAGP